MVSRRRLMQLSARTPSHASGTPRHHDTSSSSKLSLHPHAVPGSVTIRKHLSSPQTLKSELPAICQTSTRELILDHAIRITMFRPMDHVYISGKVPDGTSSSPSCPMHHLAACWAKIKVRASTHLQEVARAFMEAGPTWAMPDMFRLRSLPLSVRAATPTSVTFVHRLNDTSCMSNSQSLSPYVPQPL